MGVQTEARNDVPAAPLFVPAPVSFYFTCKAKGERKNFARATLTPSLTPPPPPSKSGTDVETQIYPGDLFDFDREVEPILEVLVGRTLEQSIAEIAMERELTAIRLRREEFEAVRSAELHEVQRLEGEVRRRAAEKARRKEQETARVTRETAIREKVAAAAFARSYLTAMRRNVFSTLHEAGHFYDPLKRELAALLPAMYADVAARTGGARSVAEGIVAALLCDALGAGASTFAADIKTKLDAEEARVAAIAAVKAEKARVKAEAAAAVAAAEAAEAAAEAAGTAPQEEDAAAEE